jgi:maltose alpha-D-glucosyltransferase/alpha-amylase
LFGRTEFPAITDKPYLLTLGPHAFYWFSLESKLTPAEITASTGMAPRPLTVAGEWPEVFSGRAKTALEALLPDYLRAQRWFGGKAKTIKLLTLKDAVPVLADGTVTGFLALVQVDYVQGDPELYSMPLAFASGEAERCLREQTPRLIIASLNVGAGETGVLHDALGSPRFCQALLDMALRRRRGKGLRGDVEGSRTAVMRRILGEAAPPAPSLSKAEQSNSSVLYGDKIMLKLFRRLDVGINPDLEIGRFLTGREFPNVPPLAGALEYLTPNGESLSLAIVYGFISDAKDAWLVALDALGRYYDRVGALHAKGEMPPPVDNDLLRLCCEDASPAVQELIGTYLESARLLGERTAGMHLALASEAEAKHFAPEPFTPHYVRGLFQSMRNLATQNLRLLRKQLRTLPAEAVPMAERVLALEGELINRYRPLFERRIRAHRIRIHGDYHLGQVLWTGKDFVILDFEGEPAVALSERRIKRSPLRDVAGMIRSFHYAAYMGLQQHVERGSLPPENLAMFEPWARFWNHAVSATFLRAYRQALGPSKVLPETPEDLQVMLHAYLLNKASYELGYELNNRPAWLKIPLQGILHLLEEQK